MSDNNKTYTMHPEMKEMFEDFMDKVNQLKNVSIYMDRQFGGKSGRAEITSSKDNPKLILMIDNDIRRTMYGFDVSKKILNTNPIVSLDYGANGIDTRTVDTRYPNDVRPITVDIIDSLRLTTSKCFNQTNYGGLFIECDKVTTLDSIGSVQEYIDYIRDVILNPDYDDEKNRANRIVDIITDEGVEALGVNVGLKQHILYEIKKAGSKSFVSLSELDQAYENVKGPGYSFTGDLYGLDTLYQYLKNIDTYVQANPGVVVDITNALSETDEYGITPKATALNQAFNALAVYKAVSKMSIRNDLTIGDDLYDNLERVNGRRILKNAYLMRETDVYDKCTNIHCYPKNMMISKADDISLTNVEKYRIYHSVATDGAIDEPMSLPAAYICFGGDIIKNNGDIDVKATSKNAKDKDLYICVADENGQYTDKGRFTLHEFLNGIDPIDIKRKTIRDKAFCKLPAFQYFEKSESDIAGLILKTFASNKNKFEKTEIDIMDVEYELFDKGLSKRFIQKDMLNDDVKVYHKLCENIIDNRKTHYGYQYNAETGVCVGSNRTYVISYDNELGMISRRTGVMSFGNMIEHSILESSEISKLLEQKPYAKTSFQLMSDTDSRKEVKNLRKHDYQMIVMRAEGERLGFSNSVSYKEIALQSPLFQNVQTYEKTAQQIHAFEADTKIDSVKKGIAINDMIIMTYAYKAYDAQDIAYIADDVLNALHGKSKNNVMYRPTSKIEADVLRALYGDKSNNQLTMQNANILPLDADNDVKYSCFGDILLQGVMKSSSDTQKAVHTMLLTQACLQDTIYDSSYTELLKATDEVIKESQLKSVEVIEDVKLYDSLMKDIGEEVEDVSYPDMI